MFLKALLFAILFFPYSGQHVSETVQQAQNERCTLPAPSSLTAKWADNRLAMSWKPVENADAYHIRVENMDTQSIIIEDIIVSDYTTYVTSGLDASADYRVSIRSMCGPEDSEFVIIIDVTGI
jgi:Fibronectin type III domain